MANSIRLDRAAIPEEVGVDSREISALLDDFRSSGVEVHSLMIVRRKKVAYESWAFPFCAEMPHIMFSNSLVLPSEP